MSWRKYRQQSPVAGHATKPEPKGYPHYCQTGECWCSGKLPSSDYPAECIKIKCEYHQ